MFSLQHDDSAVDMRADEDGSGDNEEEDETITIHDSIHGHISIHPLVRRIIDTPEFDR